MARAVLTNATVSIGGTDFTNHVKSITVTTNVDDVDLTAMGDTSHTHAPGLRDDSITVEFYQDFSTSVHATIQPLLGSSTGATIIVHPNTTTGSSTNPSMSMVGIPFTYNPLDGTVGAASMTKITFKPAAGSSISFGTVTG